MAETVSYDVLRRTRVQLDVVAMLLWRKMWATLDLSTVNIFMYADGSPQWRGRELYAVTMDVIIDTGSDRKIMRRMFPILELGLNALSARGKALATLWMLHLMAGPYTSRFLDVLTRVRSITSDLGTERKLAHMVDCAPEFWGIPGFEQRPPLSSDVVISTSSSGAWMGPRVRQPHPTGSQFTGVVSRLS